MLEATGWFAAAFALSFIINLVPAFMPSTWMILAFFYIKFDLPLVPLTIGGAIASALGRYLLAKASTLFKRRFLRGRQGDMEELGEFLNEHRNYMALTVFVYALTPLPTNNLFIAAGMVEASMTQVLAGFITSRVLANTFWVWATHRTFQHLGDLFRGAAGSWLSVLLELMGVTSVILLYFLPWERWLSRYLRRRPLQTAAATGPPASLEASTAAPDGRPDPP